MTQLPASSKILMRIHLKIWRQPGPNASGRLVDYTVEDVSPDMSFLAMPTSFQSSCPSSRWSCLGVFEPLTVSSVSIRA